jgi:hypothetical protein
MRWRRNFIVEVGLLLTVSLSTATPRTGAAPRFAAPFLSFDAGSSPYSLAVGDLNGDGKLDLVVANEGSNTVSVLLGNGDGSFGVKTDYSTGVNPFFVAISDQNGDGKLDLVVAGSSTLSVLLGNGDGSFGPAHAVGLVTGPVAIGDLNGDGIPDVVTSNANSNTVSVLLGNGDGTFGPKSDYGVAFYPGSVAIGDLNGDGKPDLAVSTADGAVSVLLGNGDGSFGPAFDGVRTGPGYVAIGDLNGDGKPDLAIANGVASAPFYHCYFTVSVFLGNGDGTFGAGTDYQVGCRPSFVAIGDLNRDGKPDLVVTATGSNSVGYPPNTVSILLGKGDGTFYREIGAHTGPAPSSVGIGDLDGDGKPDLAVANSGSNTVSVLLGNGDGSFGVNHDYPTGDYALFLAIGDLNGDGKPDLVTTNFNNTDVSVRLGNGDGSFGALGAYTTGGYPYSAVIADLNGDGKPDLATGNETYGTPSTLSVLLGNGNGSFGVRTDYAAGGAGVSLAVGDLNGDGKPDLVVTNYVCSGAPCYVGSGQTVSVLLGNGDGSFGARTDYGTGSQPRSVALGDLNGDGRLDLVVANQGSNTVSVLLGNGDGSFGARTDYGTGVQPYSVAIGDLNGDSKPDVVVANSGSNTVSVLLGVGDGGLGVKTDYVCGGYPTSVAIGDLNGDGIPDLATANRSPNTVSVLLGSGDGSFGLKSDYGTGAYPYWVAIADLNGDGRLDLATANSYESTVSVLIQTSEITTPTGLALVDAHSTSKRVELRWFGASMAGVAATVYRRTPHSAWTAVASIAGDGTGMLHFADASVEPGARYGYRLGVREGGAEEFYGETWISVPAPALTLDGLRPNPTSGEAVASFTLPNGSPARLELVDVTGRVWLTRAVGDLGAGSHLVHLGSSIPVGMYWLRLTQGGRSLLARGVVVR